MKSKVTEIFASIQGEGPYAGVRQVFVRFFQCHMHCVWCDTPDSIGDGKREYMEYTVPELWRKVKPLTAGCRSVSLTGGEPLLQADVIKQLIPYIRKAGLKVYLETSGVLHQELKKVIAGVDIISLDLKLPSSTGQRAFWKEHEDFLKLAKRKEFFIKTVITPQTSLPDVRKAVGIVKRIAPKAMFILQPNTFDIDNGAVKRCAEFHKYCVKYLPDARILPQMHKFLNVR